MEINDDHGGKVVAAQAAAFSIKKPGHMFTVAASAPSNSTSPSPTSFSPPETPNSAYRWNSSEASVINSLWRLTGGNGNGNNNSDIVTAFNHFNNSNPVRTVADLQSHLGDWGDWGNLTGSTGTSTDTFYFANYTPGLSSNETGGNSLEEVKELLTWWDVWLGKPFPSGYTQLAIVLLAFFLTCIMILVVVGNLLVCIAIATEKSLKPVQNWFIASLAVSDLLIGLVIMPFSLARELMGYWMFGQIWCDVHAALDVLLCTASINSLFLISLDRFWSITQAVKYLKKRTPSRAAFMIAFVWIFSALVSLPPLVGWKKAEATSEYPQCNLSDDIGYVLYSSIGSFWLPASMMVFVYIRIFIAARSRARKHIAKKRMKIPIEGSKAGSAAAIAAAAQALKEKEKSYSTTVGTTTSLSNPSPPENAPTPLPTLNLVNCSGKIGTGSGCPGTPLTADHQLPPLPPLPKSPPPPQIVIDASPNVDPESRRASWNIISTSELISSISIIGSDPLLNPSPGCLSNQPSSLANTENPTSHCLRLGDVGAGNGCSQPQSLYNTNENSEIEPEESTGTEHCEAEAEAQQQRQQQNKRSSTSSSFKKVYFPSFKAAGRAIRGFRNRSASRPLNNGQLSSLSKSQISMGVDEDSDTADSPTSKEHPGYGCNSGSLKGGKNATLTCTAESKAFLSAPQLLRSKFGSSLSIADYELESELMEEDSGGTLASGNGNGSGKKGSGKKGSGHHRFGYHSGHHDTPVPMGMVHLPSEQERHKRKIAKARERRATLIVGLIMAAFITAWLPFFVLYLLAALCSVCNAVIPGGVFAVAFWLGYCNSAANPIIYTIFNRDYRKAFRKILFK